VRQPFWNCAARHIRSDSFQNLDPTDEEKKDFGKAVSRILSAQPLVKPAVDAGFTKS